MKIITLDGPAGAGKSSTAKALAHELGWYHMDTGAMYRSVALAALEQNISLENEKDLAELAASLDIQSAHGDVFLNGRNITAEIRTDRVTTATRSVADAPSVREEMKKMQRSLSEEFNLVTEGRDQGTIVFPDAGLKIYLTASIEERVKRRFKQLKEGGISVNLRRLRMEIEERDDRDSKREISPLKPAKDAIIVETTTLDAKEVVKKISGLVIGKIPNLSKEVVGYLNNK